MRFIRISHVFLCLFISAAINFGQKPAEPLTNQAEIEKTALALLERSIGEAANLRLSENRIHVLTVAADLLWTREEKRSRTLFRRAAAELTALTDIEDDGDDLPENFWIAQNVRQQFLHTVANRDAELALELLKQTRFPIFERMLNLPPEKIPLYRNLYSQAQQELNLEKNFAARLFSQNPRRALEIARANLKQGASYGDLELINQLKSKEPELAARYAEEVLQVILASDFSDQYNYNNRCVAQSFLSQFSSPANDQTNQNLKINQISLRRLAVKYADYLLENVADANKFYEIQSALPVFERILPERIAALKQKAEKLQQNNLHENPFNHYQEKFNKLRADAAPEALLSEIENFPVELRVQFYNSAASSLANAGNYSAARQLLSNLPGKQSRQNALFQLDWQAMQRFLNERKYAEAEQIIRQQNDRSVKIRFLILATGHFAAQKESEKAAAYIAEARTLVNPSPENHLELLDLMQVLAAAAETEPEKTFDLIESFIPKFNEIYAAIAFLSKYQPHGAFRDGELVFANGGVNGLYLSNNRHNSGYVSLDALRLNRLGIADLDRAIRLIDRFDRADLRLAARLIALRGILSESQNGNNYPQNLMHPVSPL